MSRSNLTVLMSASLFAIAALVTFHVIDWRIDGIVLTSVAALHLAVVLKCHPKLDSFVVITHYAVLAASVGGILWILAHELGFPAGSFVAAVDLALEFFEQPGGVGLVLTKTALAILVAILLINYVVHRRRPSREDLVTGLFVATILNFTCFFAITDPTSTVVVYDPEGAPAYTFGVGLSVLVFPLLLHVLVLIPMGVYSWRSGTSRGT